MHVLTPSISWHNRDRIASVDFQPVSWPPLGNRLRLASAGDDHHVVVSRRRRCLAGFNDGDDAILCSAQLWDLSAAAAGGNLHPQRAGSAEGAPAGPTFLCDLSRHQNSVNVVRWSKDGTLLASGDTGEKIHVGGRVSVL